MKGTWAGTRIDGGREETEEGRLRAGQGAMHMMMKLKIPCGSAKCL